MSARDTNIEKQAKRHKPSLWGLAVAALIPIVLLAIFLGWGNLLTEDDATSGVTIEETAQ